MGILKSYNESRLTETKFGPGGNPGSSLPIGIKSRIDDLTRMTKIIASSNGVRFIANNAKLNQVENENSIRKAIKQGGIGKAAGQAVVAQLKDTTKLVASTLAQVPVNGTGTHLVHKFRTDTYLRPTESEERSGLAQFLGAGGVEGAPFALAGEPVVGKVDSQIGAQFIEDATIQFVGSRDDVDERKEQYQEDKSGNSKIPIKLNTKRVKKYKETAPDKVNAFLRQYKLGDPKSGSFDPSDEINLSPIEQDEYPYPDLAVLRFGIVTPEYTNYLQFRAYISQFSDNFTGNWSGYQYLGRGENFYTYSGFDRSVSLGFKIFAQSGPEMKPLYDKVQLLASATAPTYNVGGFMRGTLTKLTVGGYVKNIPGFIESVNYSISQDEQWDIGSDYTDQESLPMSMDCTVSFKPIHTFVPRTGTFKRFIAPGFAPKPGIVEGGRAVMESEGNLLSQDTVDGFNNG